MFRGADRVRHREDDRPQPAAAGAGRCVRRGWCRLARRYDVASVCVRPGRCGARSRSRGKRRGGRHTIRVSRTQHRTGPKDFEARRALEDGATELDIVQIGALSLVATRTSRADIRAIVEVATLRRHRQGDFENAYLTTTRDPRLPRVRVVRCRLRQDEHGFAPAVDPRRSSPHACKHVAAHRGQGGGGVRPGRVARGDGARRDAHRRHTDRGDHRGVPRAQGRAEPAGVSVGPAAEDDVSY